MSTPGEAPTSQAYGYVWISAPPASPNTAVVGNPVANPVANADLNPLGNGVGGSNVAPSSSQDITTMANAVPQEEFTNGISEAQSQASLQASIDQPTATVEATVLEGNLGHPQETIIEVTDPLLVCRSVSPAKYFDEEEIEIGTKRKKHKVQRRRLSPAHREMIIDLVFNEKKTSREVARYMGLPQSTVMSVVQVFKKEHRIHKKTATGRKRRLTTAQEFQLFEMSQERENISVDEIRSRFLQQHPDAGHISKTTIYRTLERGKKGLIGMEPPAERYGESAERYWSPKKKFKSGTKNGACSESHITMESSVNLMEEASPVDTVGDKDNCRQRRSLSIAEREMIISLFFNENRTVREVADFMHLAKSTVSSVVQVFKKEHRIQRKASTGRKKKLSDDHEQMIMDILTQKEDITIEETRSRFLNLNPEVPNISKSTIYRIMENCQSKLARSDMEVFVGTFVHATESNAMVILTDTVMGVLNSTIEFMENLEELDPLKAEYGFTDSNIFYMTANQFMMPGFIDTHIHASQFPNNGVAMNLTLLDWLQNITFPTEASFSDTLFAREVYTKAVDRLLRNGTTTASYYATIHLEGSKILADVVNDKGQRALIGKVNMMRNCPDYYREMGVQESVNDTEEFIRYVRNLQNSLILPVITPRFAPTCPEDQMLALGQLASKYGCHIQSHLCENKAEIAWVKELFPWAKNYTEVYDSMRLLGDKSIMAHCIWLTDDEIYTLRERGTGISHCPNSNITLKSGLCPVRKLLTNGIKVGLGTDCSAGFSSSLLDTMRCAVQTSNVMSMEASNAGNMEKDSSNLSISMKETFRMATLGGAKVLNLEHKIGNFEIDKEFDALLIDVVAPGSPFDLFSKDSMEEKVMKFLYNGDDRNIERVYVAGRRVLDVNSKTAATHVKAA